MSVVANLYFGDSFGNLEGPAICDVETTHICQLPHTKKEASTFRVVFLWRGTIGTVTFCGGFVWNFCSFPIQKITWTVATIALILLAITENTLPIASLSI